MTTPDITTRAKALLEGITKGGWAQSRYPGESHTIRTSDDCIIAEGWGNRPGDAAFIAAAPNLVRELVEEVERLENETENLEAHNEELQQQAENAYSHGYRLGSENYKGPI